MSSEATHLFHFCNINSFFSKREQVKTCLNTPPFSSLLALCEVKVSAEDKRSIKVRGYDPILFPGTRSSSGILVYVRHSLPHQVVQELALTVGESMIVFVDVALSASVCVRCAVAYIHPNAGAEVVRVL